MPKSKAERLPDPVMVEAGGGSYAVRDAGPLEDSGPDRPPLVLVHGYGGDMNGYFLNHMRLARQRRVIALDLPGHGATGGDVGDGRFETLAGALLDVVDHLVDGPFHLFGHSMGGAVAMRAALSGRAELASLVTMSSAGFAADLDIDWVAKFQSATDHDEIRAVLEHLYVDAAWVSHKMVEYAFEALHRPGARDAMRTIAENGHRNGGQEEVLAPRLEGADVPMLVIWGAEDRVLPASHARNAPSHARVEIADGVGHCPQIEAMVWFERVLNDFLNERDTV